MPRTRVFTPDGSIGYVDDSQLEDAKKQGFRVATDAQAADYIAQKRYGDQSAKAFIHGLGRTVTFGGTDWALKKLGAYTEQELQDIKRANPTAAAAGEFGGYLIPGGAGNIIGRLGKGAASVAAKFGLGKVSQAVAHGGASAFGTGVNEHAKRAGLGEEKLSLGAAVQSGVDAVPTGMILGGVGGVLSKAGSGVRSTLEDPLKAGMAKRSADIVEGKTAVAFDTPLSKEARRQYAAVPKSGLSAEAEAARRGEFVATKKAASSGTVLPDEAIRARKEAILGLDPKLRYKTEGEMANFAAKTAAKEAARLNTQAQLPEFSSLGEVAADKMRSLGDGGGLFSKLLPGPMKALGNVAGQAAKTGIDSVLPQVARAGSAVLSNAPMLGAAISSEPQPPQEQQMRPQGPDMSWLEQYPPEQREQILRAIQAKLQTLLAGTGQTP